MILSLEEDEEEIYDLQDVTQNVITLGKNYIVGEFHAWDNCTSIGISVIFYPCKQIKLY